MPLYKIGYLCAAENHIFDFLETFFVATGIELKPQEGREDDNTQFTTSDKEFLRCLKNRRLIVQGIIPSNYL